MPEEKPKPDLANERPDLREMLIERRNYWRAKRGQPLEMWDSVHERLVNRDEHMISEAINKTIEALKPDSTQHAPVAETALDDHVVTEVTADHSAAVTETAPEPPASPAPPEKPFHQMPLEEFQAAAASHLSGIFERTHTAGAPFSAASIADALNRHAE